MLRINDLFSNHPGAAFRTFLIRAWSLHFMLLFFAALRTYAETAGTSPGPLAAATTACAAPFSSTALSAGS
jgi:hypothetical protein